MASTQQHSQQHSQQQQQQQKKKKRRDSKTVKKCELCDNGFTLFFRRHTCRSCLKIICAKCSGGKIWSKNCVPVDHNIRKEHHVRVCDDCQTKTREFHRLINAGDINAVTAFYRRNDPNRFHLDRASAFYENGWYPLHLACKSGSIRLVRWLSEVASCTSDVLNDKGQTPLEVAAILKRFECVQYLHDRGASLAGIRDRTVMLDVLEKAMDRLRRGRRCSNGSANHDVSRVADPDATRHIADNAGLTESEALSAAIAASADMTRQNKTTNGVGLDEDEALSIAIAQSVSMSATKEADLDNRTTTTTTVAIERHTPSAPIVVETTTNGNDHDMRYLPTAEVLESDVPHRGSTADLVPPSTKRASTADLVPPLSATQTTDSNTRFSSQRSDLPPPPAYETESLRPPPSYETSSTTRAPPAYEAIQRA